MLNALASQLGNVDQTFDPVFDAGESTEVRQLGHVTANQPLPYELATRLRGSAWVR